MFDNTRFLKEHFGGPDGVIHMLTAYGMPVPKRHAVEKWFLRGTTPGSWLPVLLGVRELETGEPVGLAQYLTLGRAA